MLPCEVDDGPGGAIISYLLPAGTQVGRQLPQAVGRLAIPGQAAVASDDVDHVQSPRTLDRMRAARRSSMPVSGTALTATMIRSVVSHNTGELQAVHVRALDLLDAAADGAAREGPQAAWRTGRDPA